MRFRIPPLHGVVLNFKHIVKIEVYHKLMYLKGYGSSSLPTSTRDNI